MNQASNIRQSLVIAVAHSRRHTIITHLEHHSWAPIYISIMTQGDTPGLQFHAVQNPPPPLNHYGKFYARKHKDSNPPAPPTNLCFLPHRQHALNYIRNPSGTQNLKFIRNNMAKSYFFLSISVCPSLPNHCRCKGSLLHLITFNDTRTFGRTPLGEGSATSRDLYLTTHNIHKRETPTLPAGFEPAVPASDRPQTYNLDRRAKQT